jgi:hypothetical protein
MDDLFGVTEIAKAINDEEGAYPTGEISEKEAPQAQGCTPETAKNDDEAAGPVAEHAEIKE